MKKILFITATLCILFSFSACTKNEDKPEILEWTQSEIYTDEEINSAIDVVCSEFRHWKGCKLETITYAGDEMSMEHIDWATQYDLDQSLVLISSFSTNNNPQESFEKNKTYDGYKWILARNNDEKWHCVANEF